MPRIAGRFKAQPALSPDQHRALMAGFFGIMDRWAAGNAAARAILGSPPARTFFKWKVGDVGTLSMDTVRRIGYVSGIWKALEILYGNHLQADTWVKRPNRAFGGQSPLARMAAGDITDLAAVRTYLDAARAPWS
jgi:uncharacterized protein (DUF2384 family)